MFIRTGLLLVLCTLTSAARVPVVSSALHRAVIANDLSAIRQLLATPEIDINAQDSNGRAALHHAALLAHRQAVGMLIAHDAEARLKDNDGKTPFTHAVDNAVATAEHAAIAATLLEVLAGVKGRDEKGWSPLNWAVLSQDYALVQALIDRGAEIWTWRQHSAIDVALLMEDREMLDFLIAAAGGVEVVDGRLKELMIETAGYGDLQSLIMLLELGIDVNAVSVHGYTALTSATILNNLESVRVLLARGANTEATYMNGKTALIYAIEQGHSATVKLLLEHSASHDSSWLPLQQAVLDRDYALVQQLIAEGTSVWEGDKQSAVDIALILEDEKMLTLLIAADSDGKIADRYWLALLAKATKANSRASLEIMRLVVENDVVNINTTGYDGRTALLLAARQGDLVLAQALLKRGANINAIDTYYNTALKNAVMMGHAEMVSFLLEQGADVNAVSGNGITALMLAAEQSSPEIIAELLRHGAKVDAKSKNGHTALTFALRSNRSAAIKILFDQMDKISESDGQTALIHFVSRGDLAAVKKLLQRGIDIDARYSTNDHSALMYAALFGHKELVSFLLEQGAPVDANDIFLNRTALMHAAEKGHLKIVQILIAHDADINAASKGNITALMKAAQHEHWEVVELLLQHGAEFTDNHRECLLRLVESPDTVTKLLALKQAQANL